MRRCAPALLGSSGSPSSTSPRCSPGLRRHARPRASRSSTSAAAIPRSCRRRRTSSRRSSSRRASRPPRVHGYAPFRGLSRAARGDRGPLRAESTASSSIPRREVAVVPGTKTALVELALVLAERGDTVVLPDPGYPDYPSGVALAGARAGCAPARRGGRPELGRARRASDVAAVYLNYPSNPCAVRGARRRVRARRSSSRARPARRSCTTSPTATSSSTGARRESFLADAGRDARSASRCSRCRRATGWPAGGSASWSATRRSSRG